MQSEQQQRIMGYFIEEAKDHLNTIEQGLLNLQSTIADPEMVSEVFRAAHSVKGGAAMLGLGSIQKTSHRLEDYFKVLKECPVKVDQKLESLFLRVFDTLQELLEQLQGPFGLTDDKADEVMREVEPVFASLNDHLGMLVSQSGGTPPEDVHLGTQPTAIPVMAAAPPRATSPQPAVQEESALQLVFQSDVPVRLREMLQLFKQADDPASRLQLQEICQSLAQAGEQFELLTWCNLLHQAQQAIACSDNNYRTLAPVVIKEIKQAQELVLSGKDDTITVSESLQSLIPTPIVDEPLDDSLVDLLADVNFEDDSEPEFIEFDLESSAELFPDDSEPDFSLSEESSTDSWLTDVTESDTSDLFLEEALDISEFSSARQNPPIDLGFDSIDVAETPSHPVDHNGPEVGMAELNSLADLFEGEVPDLGMTWQEEEVIDETPSGFFDIPSTNASQSNQFVDLLDEQDELDELDLEESQENDLSDLLNTTGQASAPEGESLLASKDVIELADLSKSPHEDSVTRPSRTVSGLENLGELFADLDETQLGTVDALETVAPPLEHPSPSIDPFQISDDLWVADQIDTPSETNTFEVLEDLVDDDALIDSLMLDDEPALTSMGSEPVSEELSDPWATLDLEEAEVAPVELSDPWAALDLEQDPGLPMGEEKPLLQDQDITADLWDEQSALSRSMVDAVPSNNTPIVEDVQSDPFTDAFTLNGSDAESGIEVLDVNLLDDDSDPSNILWAQEHVSTEPSLPSDNFELDFLAEELIEPDATELGNDILTDPFASFDQVSELDFLSEENSDRDSVQTLNLAEDVSLEEDTNFNAALLDDSLFERTEFPELTNASAREDLLSLELESSDGVNRDSFGLENDPVDVFADGSLDLSEDLSDVFAPDRFSPDPEQDESARVSETEADLSSLFGELSDDLESEADLFADTLALPDDVFEDAGTSSLDNGSGLTLEAAESAFDLDFATESDLDTVAPNSDISGFELNPTSGSAMADAAFDLGFDTDSEAPESTDSVFDLGFGADSESAESTFDLAFGTNSGITESAESEFDLAFGADSDSTESAESAFDLGFGTDSGITESAESEFDLAFMDDHSTSPDVGGAMELDFSQLESSDAFAAETLADRDFDDLDMFLDSASQDVSDAVTDTSDAVTDASSMDFADLDALLGETSSPSMPDPSDSGTTTIDDFADLDALLEDSPRVSVPAIPAPVDDDFADLDALLGDAAVPTSSMPVSSIPTTSQPAASSEFDDLEKLLEDADQTLGGSPIARGARGPALANRNKSRPTRGVLNDQTMRVSVKSLDNLNNLVGELVVNRNTLEQAEERLRQFLDNLLYQVQQLSDVGQRMRDLYERSLLESSLLSSRKTYQLSSSGMVNLAVNQNSHATGASFDALEMDRFTGFHTLSQEMIELIVRVRESASDIDFVVDETDQVTRNFRQITTQLQEGLTRSRMVPFGQTADRLPRAVRDISIKCGKDAELIIEGRDTLIDKMILEQLYDPMTHLVNNAITHGVETPDERSVIGKPTKGRITVRAFHQGNQTVISVMDDGAGIDPDKVKRKAVQKGLITAAESDTMSRLDVYDLLFHHGFSTKDKADDFSGRGVGMDVVRTSLNEIRGVINIDSAIGRGTTFTIRLPLTLSISKALCCISNRARIAFPMDGVEDMLDVPKERILRDEQDRPCIQWRDQVLPFQSLSELLRYNRSLGRGSVYGGNQEEDIISMVVLRSNAGNFLALQVDQVLGEQEIVIKQLEGPVPKPVGVAGATVLGDGRIMPIADVLELIDLSLGRIRREAGTLLWDKVDEPPTEPVDTKTEPTVLIVDDSITVRELLSMTFNKIGYRVEQARDGQEAWEKLRSGLPCDLVFCDIEMPRMDGLELLSRIQKDANLTHIPIAMLTSRGADRHRQMAIQLGAKGYFTKPYLEEALLDAAQRMLKGEVLVTNGS